METTIDISEIVETIAENDGEIEICATAAASYDNSQGLVTAALGCFSRRVAANGSGGKKPRPWLPSPQVVAEHLSQSDASGFAKDVFSSWVRKIRSSIPRSL